VELIGSNMAPFYNQRRIDKLEPLTPHEMPIPAKELGVLGLGLYTWGGASNPPNSTAPARASASVVRALVTNSTQRSKPLSKRGLKSPQQPAPGAIAGAVVLAFQQEANGNRRQRARKPVGASIANTTASPSGVNRYFEGPSRNMTEVNTQLMASVDTNVGTAMPAAPWSVASGKLLPSSVSRRCVFSSSRWNRRPEFRPPARGHRASWC